MDRDILRLSENIYDLVVIGGGVYGLFVAWDASLRGLSVALLDKGDFGHATSSNSSRVIHGGLRYLQYGDIRRVRQSTFERMVFMRIAPHLVQPIPFLVPTYGHFLRGKEAFSLALLLNDIICSNLNRLEDPQKYLPKGRVISKDECLQILPSVKDEGLNGGAIFYDCQMYSSERFILSLVHSATNAGADMVNYVEVTKLHKRGDSVVGVTARDLLSGDDLDIRAKVIVNTSGPWLDQVLGFLDGYRPKRKMFLSKAFNLFVKHQLIPDYGVGVYSKGRSTDRNAILGKGQRLLFIIPWHNGSLIGTEHLPFDADLGTFQVTEEEIQAFLDEINEAYPGASLNRQDVCFVYRGLVPMVGNSTMINDVRLLKHYRVVDHQKEEGIEGLVSVIGVKFTEARYVAEKTVDLVFRKLNKKPKKSTTAITPLHGGQIERFNIYLNQEMYRKPQGLKADVIRHLIFHYGSAYPGVLKYLDNDCKEKQNLNDKFRVMKAQVLYGIREEMAQKLTDVVFRRTSLGITGKPEEFFLRSCADIMAKELNWNKEKINKELNDVTAKLSSFALNA